MDFEIIYRNYFKDVLLYVCGLSGDALLAEDTRLVHNDEEDGE